MPDPDFQQYSRHRDPEAFRRLVQRHINAVHSAAERVLGHRSALAEDVTQTVFVLLARRAAALPEDIQVGAWLHRQAVRRALNVLRTETRRERREHRFEETRAMDTGENSKIWLELKPHLDRALLSLPERDRQALVLRYLDGRALAEVGDCLGVTANAAQKRVSKALETLRRQLRRRRIALPAAVLGALLEENAVQAAPAHAAGQVAANALAATALPQAGSFVLFLTMTSTKTMGAAALLALCAGAGWHSAAATATARNSAQPWERLPGAPAPAPAAALSVSPWLNAIGRAKAEDFAGLAEEALKEKNLLHRHERLEAVFARWVEVSPGEGWDWVQKRCSEDLRESRIPRDPRLAFLLSWVSVDGPAAHAANQKIVKHKRLTNWDRELAVQWAKHDPQELLGFVSSGKWEEGNEKKEALACALRALAAGDPEGIYRKALEMPPGYRRSSVIMAVASEMARRDPDQALEWVKKVPRGSDAADARARAYVNIFGVMGAQDPARTAGLMDGILTGDLAEVKEQAARPVLESWMRTDPAAALKWATGLGSACSWLLDGLAEPGSPAAGEIAKTLKSGGDREVWEEALSRNWSPAAAKEWLEARNALWEEGNRPSVRAALSAWMREDAQAAAAWVDQLPVGGEQDELRHLLFARMARDGASPALVLAQLGKIREAPEDEEARRMVAGLGAERPREVLDLIGSLSGGKKRDAWLAQTAGAWAERDAAGASAWADAIPVPEARAAITDEVVNRWWPDDPPAAEHWAAGQPEGLVRDTACSRIAESMTAEDPERALGWAVSIGAESLRTERLASVLKDWARTAPTAALAALEALPLAPEEKTRLASSHTQNPR